jgi:nicotinamide riboside kinase
MTHLLITTGPESCGKTTLANALSANLQVPLVSEAARAFLDHRFQQHGHYRYDVADLTAIAQLQFQAEQQALASQPVQLICDTDLLVVMLWSEVKYGAVDPTITDLFTRSQATTQRHYLLCDHQIPWQVDPQRENPDDRAKLFQRYLHTLEQYQLSYQVVQGDIASRLNQVQHFLNPIISMSPILGCPCCRD